MLADGIVEDLPVVSNAIELDLLGVQNELAHDDRLVLSELASGKQEFLINQNVTIDNKINHTIDVSQQCLRQNG